MENKTITFVDVGKTEVITSEVPAIKANQVLIKTEYTAVSAGTERNNLMLTPNVPQYFPKVLGYSGVGRIIEIGGAVKNFTVGDRVLIYHGHHTAYNICEEHQLTKIEDDTIPSIEAAFVVIATMPLGGVRKLELELGESAMVMGLGILGIFAVQQLKLSGADPLIAVDFDEKRRAKALEVGADYALNPGDPDFVDQVKALTGGKGVNAIVEVTGSSAAMVQALDCAAFQGRISLLGCTRVSDCNVDYYKQVHCPGIKLIGAHNFVRPKVESYPHHWTHHDDCRCLLRLMSRGKFKVMPVISEVHTVDEAVEVYDRLAKGRDFPLGVVFKWE